MGSGVKSAAWVGFVLAFAFPAVAERLPAAADRNGDGEVVIACLGDSNTSSVWQQARPKGFSEEFGWCEQLVARIDDPRVRSINVGAGGATIGPSQLGGDLLEQVFFEGQQQLDLALFLESVDVVLMAFGTNDVVANTGSSPEDIVAHYNRLWRRARAYGMLALVATTPPVYENPKTGEVPRSRDAIAETNQLLRETFAPRYRLDFDADMPAEDYLDGLHMSAAGQATRADEARRAISALARVVGPPVGVRALRFQAGHWRRKTPDDHSRTFAVGD